MSQSSSPPDMFYSWRKRIDSTEPLLLLGSGNTPQLYGKFLIKHLLSATYCGTLSYIDVVVL